MSITARGLAIAPDVSRASGAMACGAARSGPPTMRHVERASRRTAASATMRAGLDRSSAWNELIARRLLTTEIEHVLRPGVSGEVSLTLGHHLAQARVVLLPAEHAIGAFAERLSEGRRGRTGPGAPGQSAIEPQRDGCIVAVYIIDYIVHHKLDLVASPALSLRPLCAYCRNARSARDWHPLRSIVQDAHFDSAARTAERRHTNAKRHTGRTHRRQEPPRARQSDPRHRP
jgi:hypothetical protein